MRSLTFKDNNQVNNIVNISFFPTTKEYPIIYDKKNIDISIKFTICSMNRSPN